MSQGLGSWCRSVGRSFIPGRRLTWSKFDLPISEAFAEQRIALWLRMSFEWCLVKESGVLRYAQDHVPEFALFDATA